MKKILLSLATVALSLSAAAETVEWNVSDWEAGTITENKTINGLTIYATSTKSVTVDANNKTVGGVKYTQRVKTGGTGGVNPYNRCFSFTVPGAATINCIAASSSGTEDRVLIVSFGGYNSDVKELALPTGSPIVLSTEYTGSEPTEVFIYSKSGGINFYDFSYTTKSSENPDPAPAEGVTFTAEGQGRYSGWPQLIFDNIVTPFEYNVSTHEATLKNFLGSDNTVVVKYDLTDKDLEGEISFILDQRFNSSTVSGFKDTTVDLGYGTTAYPFTAPTSYIFKKDGVNSVKLDNLAFISGYSSQIGIETNSDPNIDANVVYNFTFTLAGSFSSWDEATSSWEAKGDGTPGTYDQIVISTNIPFERPDNSGIADIVADENDENAPVEYYNLQGIRLNEPAAGQIVIRRQGSKVAKIVVR